MCTVPGGLILYCTALFCTVLYNKRRMKEGKIRKFDDKKRTDRQTDKDGIQTLRPLYPLWILEGAGQQADVENTKELLY